MLDKMGFDSDEFLVTATCRSNIFFETNNRDLNLHYNRRQRRKIIQRSVKHDDITDTKDVPSDFEEVGSSILEMEPEDDNSVAVTNTNLNEYFSVYENTFFPSTSSVSKRSYKKNKYRSAKNFNYNFEFEYHKARSPKLLDSLGKHLDTCNFVENHDFYNSTTVQVDDLKKAGLPLSFYPRPSKSNEPIKVYAEIPVQLDSELRKTWKELKMNKLSDENMLKFVKIYKI